MQTAYDEYNDHARSSGKSRGHFIVDLCRPGHLTICLRNFQERIKCNDDNWDAQFGMISCYNVACCLTLAHNLLVEMVHCINSSVPPLRTSSCALRTPQGMQSTSQHLKQLKSVLYLQQSHVSLMLAS